VYEKIYCARGEMENRIKEQQLDLFAARTSAHLLSVNQLRLLRLKLFKIGARVKVSRRRIWVYLSSACPNQSLFAYVFDRLMRDEPLPA
jgi:hypothetical protein